MAMEVTVVDNPLGDDIDLSRGDMLVRENNQPDSVQDIDARICWLSEQSMRPGTRFELHHTSREAKGVVKEVVYKLDINTLHRIEEDLEIGMNDIARVRIRTAAPILVDDYRRNRATGSFILVDPGTRLTVAAGVIYT
jgi:sulfate adenylyltransferase subunit 1